MATISLYTANSPSVSLFRSYLEQISQRVYVNGEYSSEGTVQYGVPQGSVLGALFCLFISDLPLHVTSDMVNCEMFADDTIPDASNTDPVSVER